MPTAEGLLYLAVVLDVFRRRIAGWSTSNHLYPEIMLRALNMALLERRPDPDGVIRHSVGLQTATNIGKVIPNICSSIKEHLIPNIKYLT